MATHAGNSHTQTSPHTKRSQNRPEMELTGTLDPSRCLQRQIEYSFRLDDVQNYLQGVHVNASITGR